MTEYRIPDDILAAHLEGETILLDFQTKRYYHLNATASAIWKGLERRLTREAIVRELTGQFDADPGTVGAAFDDLVQDLAARGLLRP